MIKSKKQLAVQLSKLKQIQAVDRGLEQYQTDSELAADILWNAFLEGDIEAQNIIDLGCGNGIFGIGAHLLGAKKITFVDKDKEAMRILEDNLEGFNSTFIQLKNDIRKAPIMPEIEKQTVIMNPPFGTKNLHADKIFLERAFSFADIIYSIHKAESLGFLHAFSDDNGFKVYKIWHYDFGIKKSHHMHKKNVYKVKVVCVKIVKR